MIREATPYDATQVAPLFLLGMGHIAGIFADSENYDDAIPFFEDFIKAENNQYSYQNTLVFIEGDEIIGSITGYDGALLSTLRQPVLDRIREKQPDFVPEDETQAGEYYLDCINVAPGHQGKGIGKKLILAFCERAKSQGHHNVGLIVDFGNPTARLIYDKLGFKVMGEKSFMGHRYDHMVLNIR